MDPQENSISGAMATMILVVLLCTTTQFMVIPASGQRTRLEAAQVLIIDQDVTTNDTIHWDWTSTDVIGFEVHNPSNVTIKIEGPTSSDRGSALTIENGVHTLHFINLQDHFIDISFEVWLNGDEPSSGFLVLLIIVIAVVGFMGMFIFIAIRKK